MGKKIIEPSLDIKNIYTTGYIFSAQIQHDGCHMTDLVKKINLIILPILSGKREFD